VVLNATEHLDHEREKLTTAVKDAQEVRPTSALSSLSLFSLIHLNFLNQQRMQEFKRFRDEEKRKQQANIEDRAVSLAWMAFEAKKYEFEATVYTLDDLLMRQEDRNRLFDVFDQAVSVQDEYWVEKGRKEETLAFGNESDREAKVRDVLATEVSTNVLLICSFSQEGALDFQRIRWMLILEVGR
jgi:hypothetical protein